MEQTPYTPPPSPDPGFGYPASEKPQKVLIVGIMTLVSGASNIFWSLSLTGVIVLGTLGIGLLCAPLTLLPLVLGIFEIIYGLKLIANPPQPVRPSQTLAILEILMLVFGNVISLAAGILALVFYNEPDVKAYFARFAI